MKIPKKIQKIMNDKTDYFQKFEKDKIERFEKAIGKIILKAKKRNFFAYHFYDSFNFAKDHSYFGIFVDPWLVQCFEKTIKDFEKDVNSFTFKMGILNISSHLNYAAMMHALKA